MNIKKCSACGQNHKDLKVDVLRGTVTIEGKEYTHQALCPITGIIIYISFEERKVKDNVARMGG